MSMSNKKNVTITLSECEAQVFLLALREGDEAIGNQGCTEFDLEALVPELEERKAFMKAFKTANGTPEEYEDDLAHGDQFTDFRTEFATGYFLGRLLNAMEAVGIKDRTQDAH